MARPYKDGLDYFSLDTDIDQDDKVYFIEAKHGPLSFSIIIKVFMKIYHNSFYCQWGDREAIIFSKKKNFDINLVNAVINDCLSDTEEDSIFSKELYETYGILTSRGIQKRYFKACERRKEVKLVQEYNLLSEKEINEYKNIVIVDINGVIVRKMSTSGEHDANKNPQRKEKGKEKENKEVNYTPDFEKFFNLYPNQYNKEQTFKNWKNCLKEHTAEEIISATIKYKKQVEIEKTEKRFIFKSTNFVGQHGEYKAFLSSVTGYANSENVPKREMKVIIKENVHEQRNSGN